MHQVQNVAQQNLASELLIAKAVDKVLLDREKLTIQINTIKLGKTIEDVCNIHIPHVMETAVIEVPFKASRSKQGTLRIEPDNKISAVKDPLDLPPNEMKNLIRGLIWRDEPKFGS